MTDDQLLDALDRRARAAAAGVRTAVAERPAPAFDPDLLRIDVDAHPSGAGPDRRRSRPVVAALAAAAALVIVVAAVVASIGGGDPDSTPPADGVGPDEVGRYVLSDPPEGYEVASVVESPGTADLGAGDRPVAVYGPDAETPVLGVFAWPAGSGTPDDPDDVQVTLEEMEETEVAGRRAWQPTAGEEELQGLDLVVEVGDGTYAVVTGAAPDRAQLLALGGAVTVDGLRATVPDDALPDGWSPLGEVAFLDLQPGFVVHTAISSVEVPWLAAYTRPEDGDDAPEVLYVTTVTGDPVRARAMALATAEVEEVTVRGHDAVVARAAPFPEEPGFLSVSWEERPGEIVQVTASEALGREALLAQAEGIRVADDDEVAELRRATAQEEDDTATQGGLIVGQGTFDGGATWTLVLGPDDSLALDVLVPGSSGSGSGSSTGGSGLDPIPGEHPPLDGVGAGTLGDEAWAYGRLNDEVDRVEVRLQGSDQQVGVTIVEQDGVRGWVADLPVRRAGQGPEGEVVAYAADGTELDRQRF